MFAPGSTIDPSLTTYPEHMVWHPGTAHYKVMTAKADTKK